jgi:hypothetical protein
MNNNETYKFVSVISGQVGDWKNYTAWLVLQIIYNAVFQDKQLNNRTRTVV